MLVTVVATLCQIAAPSACIEEIVTDQATLMQCGGAFAQQALAKWMSEHPRYVTGWRLSKWGCAVGYQKKVHA